MGRIWELVEGLNARPVEVAAELAHPADQPPLPTCDRTSDPRGGLWSLLTTWATMDEDQWTQEAVDRLKDEVMDVFTAHPEAEGWYRAWRQVHPEAPLA